MFAGDFEYVNEPGFSSTKTRRTEMITEIMHQEVNVYEKLCTGIKSNDCVSTRACECRELAEPQSFTHIEKSTLPHTNGTCSML